MHNGVSPKNDVWSNCYIVANFIIVRNVNIVHYKVIIAYFSISVTSASLDRSELRYCVIISYND